MLLVSSACFRVRIAVADPGGGARGGTSPAARSVVASKPSTFDLVNLPRSLGLESALASTTKKAESELTHQGEIHTLTHTTLLDSPLFLHQMFCRQK